MAWARARARARENFSGHLLANSLICILRLLTKTSWLSFVVMSWPSLSVYQFLFSICCYWRFLYFEDMFAHQEHTYIIINSKFNNSDNLISFTCAVKASSNKGFKNTSGLILKFPHDRGTVGRTKWIWIRGTCLRHLIRGASICITPSACVTLRWAGVCHENWG